MGDIKTKQGCTSHNTTTFVDPDKDWFSSTTLAPGQMNPCGRGIPRPATNPFAHNFCTQTPEKQFDDFKQETTFIDCCYCLTLRKGPHCYRGTTTQSKQLMHLETALSRTPPLGCVLAAEAGTNEDIWMKESTLTP
jgi:hypothetical protein